MNEYQQALERVEELLRQAAQTDLPEPTAMTLSTVDEHGHPSSRTVLLKGLDERGFVFYTNFNSRKSHCISANPHVALCFYWQPLKKQVHVEGSAEPVTDAEADAYWVTRPRLSQLGAWASHQSEPLASKDELDERVAMFDAKYAEGEIPRPPNWSGFRVAPRRIEFWTNGEGRLHDRELYRLDDDGGWEYLLLNP